MMYASKGYMPSYLCIVNASEGHMMCTLSRTYNALLPYHATEYRIHMHGHGLGILGTEYW